MMALKPVSKAERKFATRVLNLAHQRALRDGDVFSNQRHLWDIVVKASWKGKRHLK